MKHLTLILLLWSSFTFAQKSEVFRIDSLPKEGIVLDKSWKWHAGDNPEWVKAEYDDAGWEDIDPTKDIQDLPQIKNAEIGFFRLSVWVDSNVLNKALALKIWQTGASEIYLNGQLIHQLGRVSQNHHQEQTLLVQGTPYSILFTKAGQQILAIRYSFTRKNILLKYRPVNYVAFKAILGDLYRRQGFLYYFKLLQVWDFAFFRNYSFVVVFDAPEQKSQFVHCHLCSSSEHLLSFRQ